MSGVSVSQEASKCSCEELALKLYSNTTNELQATKEAGWRSVVLFSAGIGFLISNEELISRFGNWSRGVSTVLAGGGLAFTILYTLQLRERLVKYRKRLINFYDFEKSKCNYVLEKLDENLFNKVEVSFFDELITTAQIAYLLLIGFSFICYLWSF